MPKPKGAPKTGGRKKGTPNKVTESIKKLLNELFPEERLKRLWEYHLKNEVAGTRYRTFEMANHYLFGKPAIPIIGSEDQPPVTIDISAIPRRRKGFWPAPRAVRVERPVAWRSFARSGPVRAAR